MANSSCLGQKSNAILLNLDLNTPGARVGPGKRDRKLALKNRKNTRKINNKKYLIICIMNLIELGWVEAKNKVSNSVVLLFVVS